MSLLDAGEVTSALNLPTCICQDEVFEILKVRPLLLADLP